MNDCRVLTQVQPLLTPADSIELLGSDLALLE
jgi:hypothetical protein